MYTCMYISIPLFVDSSSCFFRSDFNILSLLASNMANRWICPFSFIHRDSRNRRQGVGFDNPWSSVALFGSVSMWDKQLAYIGTHAVPCTLFIIYCSYIYLCSLSTGKLDIISVKYGVFVLMYSLLNLNVASNKYYVFYHTSAWLWFVQFCK